ncbi:MAG: hypothetical protein AUK64_2369, partial [bacterium P201]
SQSAEIFTESAADAWVVTTNAAGCDSTIHFALTVNASTTHATVTTECESYTWPVNGSTYSYVEHGQSVSDQVVSTNAAGCPHTETLALTLVTAHGTAVTLEACDSLEWHGQYRTESGDHHYSYSIGECTATDTLHLTVHPTAHTATVETVCDSYTWVRGDGSETVYSASVAGEVYSYTDVHGCTGTDTLTLTVHPTAHTATVETVCDSYTWERGDGTTQSYSASVAEEVYNYSDVHGCANSDTLRLTVNHSQRSKTVEAACGSYSWAKTGRTYTTGGTYYNNGVTGEGCLIRDTLVLTVKAISRYTDEVTACDSVEWHGTVYYAATATPTHTVEGGSANGCDSIVTLHLTVNHATHTGVNETVCDSYTWVRGDGSESVRSESVSGEVYSYTDAHGCASTDTLTLTVHVSTTGDTAATACDGYTWYGTRYSESGTPTHTLTNAAGCDSVVTLTLTVNASTSGDTAATACDSYTWYGESYSASGTPTHTLTGANGCDSVVTLTLTVNASTTGDTAATACGSYTWYGESYSASGTAVHTLTGANGCDSVVTLTLTVISAYSADTVATACDSYSWYGTVYSESGTPTHTLTSADGCDSVVTLHLTVNYSAEESVEVTLDNADLPYLFAGRSFEEYGSYDVVIATVAGCDSTIHLTLNHNEGIEESDALTLLKVYPNPTTGRVRISAGRALEIEVLDLVGRRVARYEQTDLIDLTDLAAGTYTLRITMPEGTTLRKI